MRPIRHVRPIQLISLIGLIGLICFFGSAKKAEASSLYKAPNNLGLLGYWSMEDGHGSSVTDFSGSRNHGTTSGIANPPTSSSGWTTSGKIGQALNFDGTNDYVDLGTKSSLNLTTTLSISGWVNRSNTGKYMIPLARRNSSNLQYQLTWVRNGEGTHNDKVRLDLGLGGSITSFNSTNAHTDTGWHHIAGTYDGANVKLYFDGALDGTTAETRSIDSYSIPNEIGFDNGVADPSLSAYSAGSIDDVRIYNRALSGTEILTLYGQTYRSVIKNSGKGLVAYWPFSEGTGTITTDATGNRNNGTLTNGPTWGTGKYGNAVTFDGVDDYVSASSASSVNFQETSPFSVSSWVKTTSSATQSIASTWSYQVSSGWHFEMNDGTAGAIYFGIINGIGNSYRMARSTATTFNDGAWHLAVATYDGSQSSAGIKLYIDGVSSAAVSIGDTSPGSLANANLNIGKIGGGSVPEYFNGSIDDARIYNRVLSAQEVLNLYNSSGEAMGILNQAHRNTLTNGLVGYWSFDGPTMSGTSAIDSSGSGNTGTLTNGPVRALGRLGQALNFDGVNDYLDLGNTASLNFDTSTSFTLVAWVKRTSASSGNIFNKRSSGWVWVRMNGDCAAGKIDFSVNRSGGGTFCSTTGGLNDGSWHHIVGVVDRTNNLMTLYTDGSVNGSASITSFGSLSDIGANWNIAGWGAGELFPGSIDDVRMYSRALSAAEALQLYNMGK